MSGHWHRIARWLRLGLTSLALVVGAMPAHALPAARAAVTFSVEQRESAQPDTRPQASARLAHEDGQAAAPRSASVQGGPQERRVPETRPPGPPRRLFLAHRALLH